MDYLQELFGGVQINPLGFGEIFSAVLAVILLMASGFASGSEIAFFSLSPTDLNELDDEKNKADRKIKQLREDSERTLATILITNNLINVTIIMLCNYFFASVIDFGEARWLEFVVITVLLTFLLLLFGEIMPKVYCGQHALKVCRWFAPFIMVLRKVFYPLSSILIRSGALAEKVVHKENRVLSVDDLEQALELTDKEELKDEQNMLEGIVRFGDETAKEVMTSRQDIVGLDIKNTFADVLKSVTDNNYSRIPVWQNTQDNIRGVLYIKDLLPHIDKPKNFRWQSLIRSAYFVPETKKIDDLLREFQQNKVHIAIVVDEFGGTSGLITLEDILEEIVGEINDEYDEEEMQYTKLTYNTYVFEGKTPLTDFARLLDIDDEFFDEIEDADTLAGLLLELKGDFPSIHEVLKFKNLTFEVLKKEQRRISRVKVTVGEKPTPVET